MEKALRQIGVVPVRLLALVLLTLVPVALLQTTNAFAQEVEATLLVLAPEADASTEIIDGLVAELPEEFQLKREIITRETASTDIHRFLDIHKPNAVILLNNNTVRLYREYQAKAPSKVFPPAIITMTSFVEFQTKGLKNFTGIHYEIPALTGFRDFNSVIKKKIKRIGVIYRSGFGEIITTQKAFLEPEGFQLVPVEIRETGRRMTGEVDKALRKLLKRGTVDAIWLLNDNALLSKKLLMRSWLPALRDKPKPVLVGVRPLISLKFDFGTFAVLPDHAALGGQLAELVFEVESAGWTADGLGLLQPVSVKKILNVKLAEDLLDLDTNNLDEIDELLK